MIVSFLHFKKGISQNADLLIYNEKYNHLVDWILQPLDQHALSLQANLSGKPNYHQKAAWWAWNQARGVSYEIWHSCASYSLYCAALSCIALPHGAGCLCPCCPLGLSIVLSCQLLTTQDPAQPSLPLKRLNFPRADSRSPSSSLPLEHFMLCVLCILCCGYLFAHLSPHWALRNLSEGTFYCVQHTANGQCSISTQLINRSNNYD